MLWRLILHWMGTDFGLPYGHFNFYNLWSGFGGALPDVLIVTALIAWWKHNNCGQHRCWRVGRHPVGDGTVKVCRRHHPDLPKRLTAEHILHLHRGFGP